MGHGFFFPFSGIHKTGLAGVEFHLYQNMKVHTKKKMTWSVDKNIPLLLQTKPLDQIPFSLNVAQRFSNSTKFYSSSEVST